MRSSLPWAVALAGGVSGHGPDRVRWFKRLAVAERWLWGGLAAALPQLALTAPDLPGHGHAPPLAPGQDLHDAAVAIGLAAIAQAGPPVDLIGHSFGGTVALRIALERPALVRSLTLIEPVLFSILRGSTAYDAFALGYGAAGGANGMVVEHLVVYVQLGGIEYPRRVGV